MNTDVANCFYVKVGDLVQATIFFRDFLEMEVEQGSLGTIPCVRIKQDNETYIFLSEKTYPNQTNEIVINTNDCIAYYCLLKSKGLAFDCSPTYFTEGLRAEFTDGYGNRYVLLETRRYND